MSFVSWRVFSAAARKNEPERLSDFGVAFAIGSGPGEVDAPSAETGACGVAASWIADECEVQAFDGGVP
jgi:hypothetical protein